MVLQKMIQILNYKYFFEVGENEYIHMKRDVEDQKGLCELVMGASYLTA